MNDTLKYMSFQVAYETYFCHFINEMKVLIDGIKKFYVREYEKNIYKKI